MTTGQTLFVYLKGRCVGELHTNQGTLSFLYHQAYLDDPKAVPLSATLPLQSDGFPHPVTATYFSGLLPDERVRTKLADYLSLSEGNIFKLLEAIGGECAGAVSVYPESALPRHNNAEEYRVLDDAEAVEILASLDKRPFLAGDDDVRISGAGAQNKLVIAFVDGKIAIPKGTTPSTHIIKPAIQGFHHTVHNEFFAMRLAGEIGLTVPPVEILKLRDEVYYVIERYDRVRGPDGTIERLHQEDFCQALGYPPELKYENDGGPKLGDCFGLLADRAAKGVMAGRSRLDLLQGVIFNFLIGNSDAHGKNFSLLYQGQVEELAPFYDLMSTMIYNNPHKLKMAMKLGGVYEFKTITARSFEKLAADIDVKPSFMVSQLSRLAALTLKKAVQLRDTLNQVDVTASPVYDEIIQVIERNARQIS